MPHYRWVIPGLPSGKKTDNMAKSNVSKGSAKSSTSDDGLTAVKILLTDIDADYKWNSRSGVLEQDSGDDERNNFSDLVASIRGNGQDTPVDVRPKKSGKGYLLTTGFRRYTAISHIAKEDGREKVATILAYIRPENDAQARARNLRENSARDNLKGADLAFGVWDLSEQQKKAGGNPSSVTLAGELGKNQGYINRLLRIMQKGAPKVTALWREAPFAVTIQEMLNVVEHEGEKRQMEALQEILDAKAGKAANGAAGGKDRWIETAISNAEKVGELLGRLEKKGLINTDGLDFEHPEHMAECIKVNSKATPAQKHKIGAAAQKAYEKALNAKDPEPKEDKKGKGTDAN